MDHMLKYLPPSEKAWSLCEIYFEHAAWLYVVLQTYWNYTKLITLLSSVHPVSREHFLAEIFGPVYNSSPTRSNGEGSVRRPDSHELALLFMVFSLATLLDLTLPPNNVEAEFYHQLARAGLGCEPILVEPTVAAIQTLVSGVIL